MNLLLRITVIVITLMGSYFPQQSYAVADDNFESVHYSGSGNCIQCHDGLTDNEGKDISIIKNWSTSMMANSTRDPYWRAKVASELHRNPALSDEINDKCSRCHAPMANDSAQKDGATLEILGEGFLNPDNPYYDHALNGVSCTICHQISDDGNLGTLAGVSGQYKVLQYANRVDRPAYAQYIDPLTRPMQNNVQFTPQHGSHTSTSELCATCHDLKTPFVDAQGNAASTTVESEFPEQMVYSEWKQSAYKTGGEKEASCQSCHMPKVSGNVKISTRPFNLSPRPRFSQHTFFGANSTMMDILNNHRDELEVTATGFEQGISATQDFLKTAATLEVLSREMIGNQLKVVVKITNHAGHKLPSAYPSRRAWLHFMVKNKAGQIVFESGKLNADGSISGVAVDEDSSTYEPHYDVITAEDQVQVYEPIMKNTDGQVTHTLLRAAAYIKDNRILPAGFDKASAPNDVAVIGAAFDDDNFNLGSDTVTYQVDVGNQRDFTIDAALNYQTLSFGHLQDLFKDAASVSEVATFKAHFDSANIRSETITEQSETVPFICDSTLTLQQGQWQQISIPCELPADKHTVNDVFGDNLTGLYGTDWVIFKYNAAQGNYTQLALDDTVKSGEGYWIIEVNAESVTLDLPADSQTVPLSISTQCGSTYGCFEQPVGLLSNAGTSWNMLGNPYMGELLANRIRIKAASGACADNDGCSLNEAADNDVFHNQFWHFDPQTDQYVTIENTVALNPWMGVWGAGLGNAQTDQPVLLLPVD